MDSDGGPVGSRALCGGDSLAAVMIYKSHWKPPTMAEKIQRFLKQLYDKRKKNTY